MLDVEENLVEALIRVTVEVAERVLELRGRKAPVDK